MLILRIFFLIFCFNTLFAGHVKIQTKNYGDHLDIFVTPIENTKTYTNKIEVFLDGAKQELTTNIKNKTFTKKTKFSTLNTPTEKISITTQSCSSTGICFAPETKTITVNLIPTLMLALFFGLLASFAPCYFPLLPVLASQIKINDSPWNGLSFISGVLLANLILGVILTTIDIRLADTFQSTTVNLVFASALTYMAFATLSWSKIPKIRFNLDKASPVAIGFLSVFILSPCTSAPLAASLNLARNSDYAIIIMLLFGLGSVISLLLFMLGYNKFIPKRLLGRANQIVAIILIFLAFNIVIKLSIAKWYTSYLITGLFSLILFTGKYEKILKRSCILLLASLILTIPYKQKPETKSTQIKNDSLYLISASWCSECELIKRQLLTAKNLAAIKRVTNFEILDLSNPKTKSNLRKYKIYGPPAWLKIKKNGAYQITYGIISMETLWEIARLH